jgi:signal transduction histidine kinase
MDYRRPSFRTNLLDLSIAGFVLVILLVYTYAFLIKLPYLGLEISLNDQIITWIFPNNFQDAPLLEDKILLFGEVNLKEFFYKINQSPFENILKGSVVNLVIQRANEIKTIKWVIPGPTGPEFFRRFLSFWYLAYVFWGFGLATALMVRPRDDRWRLMVAFDYLMALWIIIGASTEGRIWYSGVLMRSLSWLLLPVALALHWTFPNRIRQPSPIIKSLLFTFGSVLAIFELFRLLPVNVYLFALFFAVIGSVSLLLYQWVKMPSKRSSVGLPLIILGILFLIAVESGLSNLLGLSSVHSEITLLFFPLLPMSYFFAIYSSNLGGMEIRMNNWIGLLAFCTFIILPVLPILAALNLWLGDTGFSEFITIIFGISTMLLGIYLYPTFRSWFGKTFLGIPNVTENLVSSLTTYLSSSLEEDNLVQVLANRFFPSFLIRQAQIIRIYSLDLNENHWDYRIIMSFGQPQAEYFDQDVLKSLINLANQVPLQTSPQFPGHPNLGWVHLVIPLSLEQQVVGLCLLGRRDPDDYYGPAEIPLLQAVMNQVTLVLVHIEQTKNLQAFLQEDIQRQEEEKLRSSRQLHDEVLGQLTVLGQNIDETQFGTRLFETYQATVKQVREVIAGLRPSALNFGLEMAFNDLVDRISETNRTSTVVELGFRKDISLDAPRYPPDVELQVYRIVEQACLNTLQHASASHLWVYGELHPGLIDISIIDNGKGFETNPVIDFEDLLKRKHYGLVGMAERAALIHANLIIISAPAAGTEVRLHWTVTPGC